MSASSSSSSSSKQAVVFIVDASPSMNEALCQISSSATETVTRTRLDVAVELVEAKICQLAFQSKTNEVGVVVMNNGATGSWPEKGLETAHHLTCAEVSAAPYPHLTELVRGGDSGMARPDTVLLRRLRHDIQPSMQVEGGRGNFCSALCLAVDSMYRRTAGKKFGQRHLILLTDLTTRLSKEDLAPLPHALDALCHNKVASAATSKKKRLENARLTVVQFEADAASLRSSSADRVVSSGGGAGEAEIRRENARMMANLVELIGGEVLTIRAPSWQQDKLQAMTRLLSVHPHPNTATLSAYRTVVRPKSMRRRVTLCLTPGAEGQVPARFSLLVSKASLPTLKRAAMMFHDLEGHDDKKDETHGAPEPLKDALGNYMTSPIITSTSHWDADFLPNDHHDDDKDAHTKTTGGAAVEVGLHERTSAVRFGSDLIAMGKFDLEGLKMHSERPELAVLAFMSRHNVPRSAWMGPPYAITPEDGLGRSSVAISALAQALHRTQSVAICRLVKSVDSDPVVGALVPLLGEDQDHDKKDNKGGARPRYLFFLQLPFVEDVLPRPLLSTTEHSPTMTSTQETRNSEPSQSQHHPRPTQQQRQQQQRQECCDDLVDSLMLPSHVLCSSAIPHPTLRSFRETVFERAIDPSAAARGIIRSFRTARRPRPPPTASPLQPDETLSLPHYEQQPTTMATQDPMATPLDMVQRARPCIANFQRLFPLQVDDSVLPQDQHKRSSVSQPALSQAFSQGGQTQPLQHFLVRTGGVTAKMRSPTRKGKQRKHWMDAAATMSTQTAITTD